MNARRGWLRTAGIGIAAALTFAACATQPSAPAATTAPAAAPAAAPTAATSEAPVG